MLLLLHDVGARNEQPRDHQSIEDDHRYEAHRNRQPRLTEAHDVDRHRSLAALHFADEIERGDHDDDAVGGVALAADEELKRRPLAVAYRIVESVGQDEAGVEIVRLNLGREFFGVIKEHQVDALHRLHGRRYLRIALIHDPEAWLRVEERAERHLKDQGEGERQNDRPQEDRRPGAERQVLAQHPPHTLQTHSDSTFRFSAIRPAA